MLSNRRPDDENAPAGSAPFVHPAARIAVVTPQEVLRAVVNRCIAEGAPVYTNIVANQE